MSHPALWTCPACGRPLTVALNPEGGEAGAHRPLEISRASAAAHACAPAARFPQFHSASSSITGYEPASGQPWQPPVSAGAEDDEGVLSQSEYTLTKPSSCPNHRDHVTVHEIGATSQGYRVIYREAHTFLEELAEATLADTRKALLDELTRVPLLIIDDLGMRKLPHTAAEDLLELIMRRYERASTILTSNRPVEDWGKLLGDTAAVTALLDRLLHHAHVLKCGPRSWRTKVQTALRSDDAVK